MTISRRDTILIAVFVNIGVMALLLMAAMRFDNTSQSELLFNSKNTNEKRIPIVQEIQTIEVKPEVKGIETIEFPIQQSFSIIETPHLDNAITQNDYVEISVKRGDSLDKIARGNGTTIQEIKKINNLSGDQITIGQTLKVPAHKRAEKKADGNELVVQAAVYYVVKSGDNPTKIARQFQVGYEDILRLNGLNEESARNLKPGDRVRVK